MGIPDHHLAAGAAGHHRWHGARLAKAMGEFGATITFVSNIPGETQTLSAAIYTFTQVPGGDAGAFRLTLISIVISMAALILSEILANLAAKKMDAA